MKPYGFKIVVDTHEKEFLFTRRDWDLLTAFDEFTNLGPSFKNLVGLDALEFNIGKKKYSVFVKRTKRYFLQQLAAVQRCFRIEQDDLCTDFSVVMPGFEPSPSKRIHCQYMGYQASASCSPGFCTLKAYDLGNEGSTRNILKVDLRRFKEFPVDNAKVIRLRRKKKESEIEVALNEISRYVNQEINTDMFQLELSGGDH